MNYLRQNTDGSVGFVGAEDHLTRLADRKTVSMQGYKTGIL